MKSKLKMEDVYVWWVKDSMKRLKQKEKIKWRGRKVMVSCGGDGREGGEMC